MAKAVGIIGGMGPAATVDLMAKIVAATPAARDQDHIRTLVDSNPSIPDRTEALLRDGPSPAPAIIESAQLLESAGAAFLVMACNTAHAYAEEVQAAVDVPLLSMIDVTVKESVNLHGPRPVGLLATTACITAEIYQSAFSAVEVPVVTLDPEQQRLLMHAIESIKRGHTQSAVHAVSECVAELSREGAEVVVAGCTEVPLVLSEGGGVPLVSSTDALARAVVHFAREGSS